MTTHLTYRFPSPEVHYETLYKDAELTSKEFDDNFKSIEEETIDISVLCDLFKEVIEHKKEEMEDA